MENVVCPLFFGAFAGLAIGLTGVGGGALMTPLLIAVFKVDPLVAVGTDLWFAAITKLFGAKVHHHAGAVDWRVAGLLWRGSLPVALAVVVWVALAGKLGKLDWLTSAIGGMVLVAALGLALPRGWVGAQQNHSLQRLQDKGKGRLTSWAGMVLGLCVTLTSVGAGTLAAVALRYLHPDRMTPRRLVATDIVHAVPLALIGGVGYLVLGVVDVGLLLGLLAGSIPAVVLASRLAHRVPERVLRLTLSLMLAIVGGMCIVK